MHELMEVQPPKIRPLGYVRIRLLSPADVTVEFQSNGPGCLRYTLKNGTV
jgi:hypothetical protein